MAVGLAERLLEEFESEIGELTLKPATGGVFEVVVDGELISSKKATGRHAEFEGILKTVRGRAGS